jgi:hypothetical protein
MRINSLVVMFSVFALGAVACGSDDEDEDTGGASSAALGASCEAYYGEGGCCLEMAGDQQASKDVCAQGLEAINSGLAQGAKPADYEPSCKAGLDAAKAASYCQ